MSKSLEYSIEYAHAVANKLGTPSQSDRFVKMARELGCDEDEAAFDDKLRKVVGVQDDSRRGSLPDSQGRGDGLRAVTPVETDK